jgi:hypothetical protein
MGRCFVNSWILNIVIARDVCFKKKDVPWSEEEEGTRIIFCALEKCSITI